MAKDKLETLIDAVCKRSGSLAVDIQNVAVMCLEHAQQHNDPRKMDRLYVGLHAASRPEALRVWAEKFSPVRWNGDGKVGLLKIDSKKYTPFNIEGAKAEPYWTPAEKVGKPLTLAALLKMIERMEGKVDKHVDDDSIAEGENVVNLRAFAKRMSEAAKAAAAELQANAA